MQSRVIDIRNSGMEYKTARELKLEKELQKRYTSSWIWRTVASLIDTNPEAKSMKWLSQKMNIPIEAVVDAIEGLEALGIIERTSEGYRKVLKYVYFAGQDLDPASILADHVLVSSQIMSRLNPSGGEGFYRTGFVATNEALVKDFCLKVEAMMKEFIELSSQSKVDRVVSFTFSNVRMTRDFKEGEK